MGTFPDNIVAQALANSGGRCECTRTNSDCLRRHGYVRCYKSGFTMQNRETLWEAHHKTSQQAGGLDVLSNCEILCVYCPEATRTYGR